MEPCQRVTSLQVARGFSELSTYVIPYMLLLNAKSASLIFFRKEKDPTIIAYIYIYEYTTIQQRCLSTEFRTCQ